MRKIVGRPRGPMVTAQDFYHEVLTPLEILRLRVRVPPWVVFAT
jgi:hypothetical protein